MGLFRKKDSVLDLTVYKKSGLLDRSIAVAKRQKELSSNEAKTVDLTQISEKNSQSDSTKNLESGVFGFLDNLADANNHSLTDMKTNNSELNSLKIKLEDLEFKLERLMERLARLEEGRTL